MSIKRVHDGLRNHYIKLNVDPSQLVFDQWCEHYGLDDDLLLEEARQDWDESMLIDMDENFPFLNDESINTDKSSTSKRIFEVLQHCYLYKISPLEHIQSTIPCELQGFERIDRALMLYYDQCRIDDYYSPITGKGKFIEFVENHECKEET